jgi:hypothetical protein
MSVTTDVALACDERPALGAVPLRRIDSPHAAQTSERSRSGAQADLELTGGMAPEAPESLLEVEEPTAAMIAAVAGETFEARREQLQLHVAQLAGHLRERLREVDRREAALHARTSQLEADIRASRLWLQERELAFQERERELKRQIEELEERASSRLGEIKVQAQDQETVLAEMRQREHELRIAEDEARERRFEVEREAVALRHAQQVWEQQREREERALAQQREQSLRELNELLEQREAQLRSAELLLSEHSQQLDQDRLALSAERQGWDQQRRGQQEAIAELRRTTEAELADLRAKLDGRQDWIERQKAGLEHVRDEALRLHRQSLEMRLLAEQLWAQISGALTPAEVTQAIAQMRLKLAEQYRLEEQQLVARREELLKVGEAVAAQHTELEQLRSGLREWVKARQEEIERQAATLVERELALDGQQEAHRQAEREWQATRRGLEQQIRDLTAQVRALPVAA